MNQDIKTFLIPNDQCSKAGLAAAWLPVNELAVFAFEKRNIHQKDTPSHYASDTAASIFHIRQDSILLHPIFRKLVNESNGVFLHLQQSVSDKQIDKNELVALSRQYRSIIRECLENLQEELSKSKDINEKEELKNYVTIFYSIECIWHLCEILFVDSLPGNIVVAPLLEWVRFHFPRHERNAAEMLAVEVNDLESHPNYWETVLGSFLQGRVEVARVLLAQHSCSDTNPFKMVRQILKAMPIYSIQSGISANEFIIQWKHWTATVHSKLDAKLFSTERNLNLMMRLAVGEEKAWCEVRENFETWYEYLAGWLFYTEPTIKSFELGKFASHGITKMGVKNKLKHLDRGLLAAMEFDIIQVINEIQYMAENGWFVSHLTDLIFHSGRLTDLEKELPDFSAEKLRESFVLDYGVTLTGHISMWPVGLSYLDYCPNDGKGAIELLLPRIPAKTESKTQKIIHEAKLRNLNNVVQNVCKIQAMVSYKRNRIGNALTWALMSKDGSLTTFLSDKFLKNYIRNGRLVNVDLLDNLGMCILANDRLMFLGKYYEFHKFYQSGDFKEAAKLLVSLLISKIIPNYFFYVLLIEAIPLLEAEELVFSSNETYTILQCLEERENLPELQDQIDILRLAAARNLARALIYEAQAY